MDKMGIFGEMLEKGQQAVQKTVKAAASDVAGSVGNQLGVKSEANPDTSGKTQAQTQNQNQTQTPPTENVAPQAASTPETLEMVKEFYAPSDDTKNAAKNPQQEQLEKQQKLVKLRQELHKETYYDPLIAYETKKPQEEEEGAAERVEKLKKEEEQKKMQLEEKKVKETQDIATYKAQRAVEANRGVSG
jgi:hypothetical protein